MITWDLQYNMFTYATYTKYISFDLDNSNSDTGHQEEDNRAGNWQLVNH